MMDFSLLTWILFLPTFTAILLLFLPASEVRLVKLLALLASCFNFILSLILWVRFDNSTPYFQFFESFPWLPFANIQFGMGVDGISIYFIVLTTFLIPACLLVGWTSIQHSVREYCIAFLILESFMLAVFVMLDLLLFYVLSIVYSWI